MCKQDDLKQKEIKPAKQNEIGGPKGLEPTRYGDWEKGGRCIDF
ncbi:MAG: succinate dehydrogenase assembly factor 4 [Pseudomonadota bacterium]